MKIDKDTSICISIAEKPSKFGTIIHNAAFQALGLNFLYKAFEVEENSLEDAIKGIKAFGIRGCGVSMPHKKEVIQYLDKIEDHAKKIGAVNTIVNDEGYLTGYNTDYYGAKISLEEQYEGGLEGKVVYMMGTGGVARAIVMVLKDFKAKIKVINRDHKKAQVFAEEFRIEHYEGDTKDIEGELIVNATPVGMWPEVNDIPINRSTLDNFNSLLDVVTNPSETKLMKLAREKGLAIIPGYKMALYQAARQFELYTGEKAPLEIMEKSMEFAAKQK